MIKARHLQGFVHRPAEKRKDQWVKPFRWRNDRKAKRQCSRSRERPQEYRDEHKNPPRRIINTIVGGFLGERVETCGCIDLYTLFGSKREAKGIKVTYLVVHANTSYNISLGCPSVNKLKVIVPTPYLAMKFPLDKGRIITVHADHKLARECYFVSLCLKPLLNLSRDVNIVSPRVGVDLLDMELNPRMNEGFQVEPNEEKKSFQLGKMHEQVTYLGAELSQDKQEAIQKRKMGGDQACAVREETDKVLMAGFIWEVQYSTWLANVVMVKKENRKWRMCIDFTVLNKACPEDAYPLPNNDALVDGALGHKFLSFLGAYSGYNQIRIATYQRLMDKSITKQLGGCLEVYVDDIVVKSMAIDEHVMNLTEVFLEARSCRIATLSQFFPKMAEKTQPFADLLRKAQKFKWSKNCETAFRQFKTILATPPILTKPKPDLDMIVYLAILDNAISLVLLQEMPEQVPVYFISRTLHDVET
ncbi:uncharacterized protein LOC113859768 [Abrus precatorius]|uniref:Uncharacterized protein LOC113859768 n=1 Tax=Abrus precatorius TaxID=3816 RepID=A0A8B8KWD1_ABRPR|nr:uncharacterized protein LOC113859768 [Abrus precatorius]